MFNFIITIVLACITTGVVFNIVSTREKIEDLENEVNNLKSKLG